MSAFSEIVAPIVTAERGDEAVFADTVSKDELPVPSTRGTSTFVKHCADESTARAEFIALEALSSHQPEPLAPRPFVVEGATVAMELIEGIRVLELMQQLPRLELDGYVPVGSGRRLLARLLSHLAVTQPLVIEASARWPTSPYPFEEKVRVLLSLLARRLRLPQPLPRYEGELRTLEEEWLSVVDTPYMDSVPRNMVMLDDRLSPRRLDHAERAAALRWILSQEPQWLEEAPIREFDFSSVWGLTTVEDDWVSLQMHEVTAELVGELTLPPGADRGRRLALTLFMRYLRFGGRKMAYALMHPAGFATRFAGHDAGFYFRRLPQLVAEADAALVNQCPAVFGRIEELSRAFDAVELPQVEDDPWFGTKHLWRESPLERGVQ